MQGNILRASNVASLCKAISQAQNGNTILLWPGDYHLTEPLVIRKSLRLKVAGIRRYSTLCFGYS